MRWGGDAELPPVPITGERTHTMLNVYTEALLQISRDYSGLPDPRTLTLPEIRFFYDGLRAELQRCTKPAPKK